MNKFFLILLCSLFAGISWAQKPAVWIISDGGDNINDPDDISAIAGYLLMSNHFDTKGIVLASSVYSKHQETADQAAWARKTFGAAYQADLANLNATIGGYQAEIPFYESAIKGMGKNFQWQESYDLKMFASIWALFKTVEKSKEIVNVLCFGPLTEQAILVSYCLKQNRQDILRKLRFISHWTSSNYHVGNMSHPEKTHNCLGDPIACDYIKKMALDGHVEFYECGGIGQAGIVEGSTKHKTFYDQFEESHLGEIYRHGKFIGGHVDDSDDATYWVLLGNYGVGLSDLANNGLNLAKVENRNEQAFAKNADFMREELLRRSDAAAGFNPHAISVDCIVPEHGMADPHAWVQNDSLYIICGHDESWEGKGSFRMDRWEVWSTTDLKNWNYHRSIYPKDTYIGDQPNCWAGDIVERNGQYYWFFSNRNINTGVVVADHITGEYKDLLGKPLLPSDIIPGHPYDPEIYEEDGVYTIIFGSGTYYMATLAEDMMSLETEPVAIRIEDENGKALTTPDKPTLFKRKDWYYLVYGDRYAMSKNLYGPYSFKGSFLSGGHTSFFEWQGQLYVLQENHDISAFFRGASLKPVYFNEDETVRIPKNDQWFPGPGRPWKFEKSTMGWNALNGTTLYKGENRISGDISGKKAIIQSAPWLFTSTDGLSQIKIKLKNNTRANKMKVSLFTRDLSQRFWSEYTGQVDWEGEKWVEIPISAMDSDYQTYIIPLDQFEVKEKLMQLALIPAANAYDGKWEIEEVIIE
ncbi:family 43 glycosylhydrolase [Persicobacter diffluens]|uniref:Cellulose-binding Sde182 nucleoside hydrolase-like domain-containing protein n=1 Tax=Persicobacter diffluens TaxID=981 RepID=A0AAN5AN28_9BACT|nr:hypothetical protein PEDI_29950 [Persicobacter diffluens]